VQRAHIFIIWLVFILLVGEDFVKARLGDAWSFLEAAKKEFSSRGGTRSGLGTRLRRRGTLLSRRRTPLYTRLLVLGR
jgi:hypothetical protein